MVGIVARRDDVMAQICDARARGRSARGADAFVPRATTQQLGDDDLATVDDRRARRAPRSSTGASARSARPGEALVRVYTPAHGHTAVDVVIDDMPFLVDSLTMALDRRDLGVHLVVHPILRCAARATASCSAWPPSRRRAPTSATHVAARVVDAHRDRPRDQPRDPRLACAPTARRVLARRARRDAATGSRCSTRCSTRRDRARARRRRPCDADELAEGKALLQWLADQHFTFLGYRAYDLAADDQLLPGARHRPRAVARRARGPVGELRRAARRRSAPRPARSTLLVLTKANARSTVHRPTHLDYVGVKRYDAHGKVVGEHRFIGLYTSSAYTGSPFDVPVLRRKVAAVIERAGFLPASHDQKDLVADPRDVSARRPVPDRRRPPLRHRDGHPAAAGAAPGAAVRAPRAVRPVRVVPRVHPPRPLHHRRCASTSRGSSSTRTASTGYEWNTRLSESVLARLHYVLHLDPPGGDTVDVAELEQRVAAAARGVGRRPPRRAGRGARRRDRASTRCACGPTRSPARTRTTSTRPRRSPTSPQLEPLGDDTPLAARLDDGADHLDLKLYGIGAQPSLSDVLPRLANMGVIVDDEHPYDAHARGARRRAGSSGSASARRAATIIDPRRAAAVRGSVPRGRRRPRRGRRLQPARARAPGSRGARSRCCARTAATCARPARCSARRTSRTRSPRTPTSRAGSSSCSSRASTRGSPARTCASERRRRRGARLADEIRAELDAVTSLDEDRILRALLHLVLATLRTNWFQDADARATAPCVALKLDPAQIPDLPLPRPMFEIFVYSPRVEGVHLRAGKVARGGIRWSDRREDFRTEVLGLMKAQRVKNAVIVPGRRQGRLRRQAAARPIPRTLPRRGRGVLPPVHRQRCSTSPTTSSTARSCRPTRSCATTATIPYLVVAADKGTAAFSDIANEIALGARLLARRRVRVGRRARLRPQGDGHHRPRRVGVGAAPLPPPRHRSRPRRLHGRRHRRHVGRRVRQRHAAVGAHQARRRVRPPARVPRSRSRRGASRSRSGKRLFELPRSSWADYDAALISDRRRRVPAHAEVDPDHARGARRARHRRRRRTRSRRPS